MSAGGVMRWRVVLELAGADGAQQVHEVGAGERPPTGHTAATLGLGLAESKAILDALQRHLVTAQVDEHCRDRRRCDRCGAHGEPLHLLVDSTGLRLCGPGEWLSE